MSIFSPTKSERCRRCRRYFQTERSALRRWQGLRVRSVGRCAGRSVVGLAMGVSTFSKVPTLNTPRLPRGGLRGTWRGFAKGEDLKQAFLPQQVSSNLRGMRGMILFLSVVGMFCIRAIFAPYLHLNSGMRLALLI